MPSFAFRGIRPLHLCAVMPNQAGYYQCFWTSRHVGNKSSVTRRVPTHAVEQTPLEVEVLPGPSSGTYRYRRTMSQRRANRPFIIGVAGGTASGKTSVCECTFSTPVVFTVIPSYDDTPVHAFETIWYAAAFMRHYLVQVPKSLQTCDKTRNSRCGFSTGPAPVLKFSAAAPSLYDCSHGNTLM